MTGKMTKAQTAGVEIVSESFLQKGVVATGQKSTEMDRFNPKLLVYDSSAVTDKSIAKNADWLFEEVNGSCRESIFH